MQRTLFTGTTSNFQYNFCCNIINLRYYATFKVRKFASLFYKINTFFQKNTTYIRLQTEQIADRENFITDRSWSSTKLFIVQDYTENANGDGPLIVENK